MTKSHRRDYTAHAQTLDRPSSVVPSVDHPKKDVEEHSRRLNARQGDRVLHRAYHTLNKDMLN